MPLTSIAIILIIVLIIIIIIIVIIIIIIVIILIIIVNALMYNNLCMSSTYICIPVSKYLIYTVKQKLFKHYQNQCAKSLKFKNDGNHDQHNFRDCMYHYW